MREIIAQAVVDALNAASTAGNVFNQPITAVLKYAPVIALADLAAAGGVIVTVVPCGPEKRSIYTRGASRKDFSLDVAIQKKVSTLAMLDDGSTNPASITANAEISGLMLLTEQIAAALEPLGSNSPLGTTGASWTGSECRVLYDLDHLLGQHVFTSLLVVTYAYR